MPSTTFASVDELKAAVGSHLGYSDWHEITQEQVAQFAEATGDHQWIHVDQEKAKDGPFGGTIAHGYLTLALAPMLSSEIMQLDGVAMGVNYGLDKLRFPAPVPVGSRVRGGSELLSAADRPGGFVQIVTRLTIEIDGGTKPAAIADIVSLLLPAA